MQRSISLNYITFNSIDMRPANSKTEADRNIESLTEQIKIDPYSQQQVNNYLLRSEQYYIKGNYLQAITDISKSLCVYPTFEGYVKRAKLYVNSQMYSEALLDVQQAERLYKQQNFQKNVSNKVQTIEKARQTTKKRTNQDKETRNFLQKSTIVVKLSELKQVVKNHEKSKQYMPQQFNAEFNKLMTRLIEQKINSELGAIKKQNEDYLKLMELVKMQNEKIKQLQKGLQQRAIDYELVFNKEMDQSTMSDKNKNKCIMYFNAVVAVMEKHYLAAKVLEQFQEKVAFQNYNQSMQMKMRQVKQNGSGFTRRIMEKLFKLFQKHEDQMQRMGQILKQIPYIGSAFKLVKTAVKMCGWIQEVKIQSECEHILATRSNVTAFNRMSTRMAYQMYRYFKVNITSQTKLLGKEDIYKKNCWEKVGNLFQKFKRNQMAAKIYEEVKKQQNQCEYAEEMGNVHASILMTGIAYGFIKLPSESEIDGENWKKQIFQKITTVQAKLAETPLAQSNQQIMSPKLVKNQKGCQLF